MSPVVGKGVDSRHCQALPTLGLALENPSGGSQFFWLDGGDVNRWDIQNNSCSQQPSDGLAGILPSTSTVNHQVSYGL